MRRAARALLAVLLLAVLLAAAAHPVSAAGGDDFTAEVPGTPGKTWIDLLSQIFPDIAVADNGDTIASKLIALRSIGAGDESWISCGDKISFRAYDARRVHLAGGDYVIVTVDLAEDCVGAIALFDAAGKLIDAVNIKGDQHVSFSKDYVRELGPSGALVIASLWHDNSNQSYDIASLVLATPRGLSSIGDVLALGSHMCGSDGKKGELVSEEQTLRVVPDGGPMARIEVNVKRSIQQLDPEDCATKLGREVKTNFTGYWRWNARKNAYEGHTKELDALGAWNQNHF